MWAFLQSEGDSDVNYDRQLVLAFFCEYYNRQARAQVLICQARSTTQCAVCTVAFPCIQNPPVVATKKKNNVHQNCYLGYSLYWYMGINKTYTQASAGTGAHIPGLFHCWKECQDVLRIPQLCRSLFAYCPRKKNPKDCTETKTR